MSPAEAGAIELEEPDWQERFEAHCARWPRSPCASEWGFESTLRDWRRWHATPIVVDGEAKKLPAPSTDGIIALARLGVMPPRWLLEDRVKPQPHHPGRWVNGDGISYPSAAAARTNSYQHDAHMYLQLKGEQWRVDVIDGRTLYLFKMFEPEVTQEIDIDVDWSRYVANAVKILEAMKGEFA